jgi:hypothetical protein
MMQTLHLVLTTVLSRFVSECGLSTKYAFDNSAYGIGSDNGYGHGSADGNVMQYGKNISSYNNIQFHAPADLLPLGMTLKLDIHQVVQVEVQTLLLTL